MDEGTQKRLDAVMEDELQLGYRIKRVPETVVAEWAHECGKAPVRVRFTKINPSRRRKIAEVVQRQYHKDLANKDILSHEQVMKFVTERGEWSTDMQLEMDRLRETTSKEMGLLFLNGEANNSWGVDLLKRSAEFRGYVEELYAGDREKRAEVLERFDRWVEYSADMQAIYTAKFAAEQGKEKYSVDYDLQKLFDATAADIRAGAALDSLDGLRDRLDRFASLQRDRFRLRDLQLRFARMFSETVEQRRDNTDELARMYFTTEAMDDKNVVLGPIMPDYESVMNIPQSGIEWLLTEAYFVQNNIPDSAREYLETFGFLEAEKAEEKTVSQPGESGQSDASPAPPTSKPESAPVAVTESSSLDIEPAMSLTTRS